MAEIINLNRARKDRARKARKTAADANAAKHGRTAGEKTRDAVEAARSKALLDGAKREPDADQPTSD